MNRAILLPALLLAAVPAAAQDSAQPRDPENYEPWLAEHDIQPGDRWARVQLDLDERGRPLECRIAETNIPRRRNNNMRFWVCQAFMGGAYETSPVMRDGVAVPGTVERVFVMPGRNSRDDRERSRRQYRREQRDQRESAD